MHCITICAFYSLVSCFFYVWFNVTEREWCHRCFSMFPLYQCYNVTFQHPPVCLSRARARPLARSLAHFSPRCSVHSLETWISIHQTLVLANFRPFCESCLERIVSLSFINLGDGIHIMYNLLIFTFIFTLILNVHSSSQMVQVYYLSQQHGVCS